MASNMEAAVQEQVVIAAKLIEEKVDEELQKLDRIDNDELDAIRKQRIQEMQKRAQEKQEWLAQGHGEYSEIPEEKEFFEVTKKSKDVIVHFFKNDSFRCKIVDKHLRALARKHVEARFVKIDVERCPFLTERLKIKIIPTLCLIKDSKTRDYIVGFTDLGNHDEFSTEMLEWRIAQADVIEYSGDLLCPPDEAGKAKKTSVYMKKKTIRGKDSDDSDDDY